MLNDTRKSNSCAKKGENACAAKGIVMLDLLFRCTQIFGTVETVMDQTETEQAECTHAIHPGEMFQTCLGTCSLMPGFRIYPVGNEIVNCENGKQWLPEETEYRNRAQGFIEGELQGRWQGQGYKDDLQHMARLLQE